MPQSIQDPNANVASDRSGPIKAVIFDAYGTLFDVHSVASLAEQQFPGKGEAISLLWRQKQLEYSWLRAMSGKYKPFWEVTRDALRFVALRMVLPMTPELEARLMKQYSSLSPFPENLAALRAMKAAGLPLGILTNGNRDMIELSVKSAGMTGLFDHLLSSQAVETFKTTAPIYDLGPKAFGCKPQEILFVSSNCWDAIASHWYGYTSFWINRTGAPLDQLDARPDYTGTLLTEVQTIAQARFS